MAKVKGGFLGEFSGSVGNITFARARGGIRTVRVRSAPGNPRSQAQQVQRSRFKQIQQFASAFLTVGLVRAFWRPYATGGLSAFNAFMRTNSAVMPGGLDPAAAVLSRSNGLPGVVLTAVDLAPSPPNVYSLTIDSPDFSADDEDLLVGAIYNGLAGQARMTDAGAIRGDNNVDVQVPEAWIQDDEDALFAYAFAYQMVGSTLRLSGSSVRKVTATPFIVPSADVPAAQGLQDAPFGQIAG